MDERVRTGRGNESGYRLESTRLVAGAESGPRYRRQILDGIPSGECLLASGAINHRDRRRAVAFVPLVLGVLLLFAVVIRVLSL